MAFWRTYSARAYSVDQCIFGLFFLSLYFEYDFHNKEIHNSHDFSLLLFIDCDNIVSRDGITENPFLELIIADKLRK